MIDIKELVPVSQEEGAVVRLRDVDGKLEVDENGNPVTIRVAGEYSKRYKKAIAKLRNDAKQRGNFRTDEEDLSELFVLTTQTYCIIAWDFASDGQPWPITVENWKALLAIRPHYQKQVQAAIEEYASFFAKPSNS